MNCKGGLMHKCSWWFVTFIVERFFRIYIFSMHHQMHKTIKRAFNCIWSYQIYSHYHILFDKSKPKKLSLSLSYHNIISRYIIWSIHVLSQLFIDILGIPYTSNPNICSCLSIAAKLSQNIGCCDLYQIEKTSS